MQECSLHVKLLHFTLTIDRYSKQKSHELYACNGCIEFRVVADVGLEDFSYYEASLVVSKISVLVTLGLETTRLGRISALQLEQTAFYVI